MKDLEYIWVAMGFGVRDDDTLWWLHWFILHGAWRWGLHLDQFWLAGSAIVMKSGLVIWTQSNIHSFCSFCKKFIYTSYPGYISSHFLYVCLPRISSSS